MDNEKTIIIPPIPNSKIMHEANPDQKVSSPRVSGKKGNAGSIAATVAGTVVAGIAGTGVGYAAATMLNGQHLVDEPVADVETETDSEPIMETEEETLAGTEQQDVVGIEPNYVDYTSADVQSQATVTEVSAVSDEGEVSEVQVLGVYEAQGDDGQMMEAAIVTDGQEVAAVVDVDGDGSADALWVDLNANQQVDEGEVYDVSDSHVQMQTYEQAYLAQQQELQAYNVDIDQQDDFINDADLTDC